MEQSKEEAVLIAAKQKLVDAQKARDDAQAAARSTAESVIKQAQADAEAAMREANAAFESTKLKIDAEVAAAQKTLDAVNARAASEEAAGKLKDLGLARSKAIQAVRDLQSDKTPDDPDEAMAYDMRFRLAEEAQRRAEEDYSKALATIQSNHLHELLD